MNPWQGTLKTPGKGRSQYHVPGAGVSSVLQELQEGRYMRELVEIRKCAKYLMKYASVSCVALMLSQGGRALEKQGGQDNQTLLYRWVIVSIRL